MKPYKKPPSIGDMSAYEGPPLFWKPLKPEVGSDDEKLSLLGSIKDQNFILEPYSLGFSNDLLISEIEDELIQILNAECGDSSIHISYCFQKVSQTNDQALRRMHLVMQHLHGVQREFFLMKFFMVEVLSMLTNLIACHIQAYFDRGNLPKMPILDEDLLKDVLKQL